MIAAFRGDFLQGFAVDDSNAFEDWIQIWRQRIRQQVINAARPSPPGTSTEVRSTWQPRRWGDNSSSIHGRNRTPPLMELLWRRGLRTEALAQYERCRRCSTFTELGPDAETTALYELIMHRAPNRVRCLAWRRGVHSHRVPLQPGRLVGRERDLE